MRVILRRRVARDRDPHRGAPLPGRAPEPGRAVLLDAADHLARALVVIAEAHERLVEAHVVQYLDAILGGQLRGHRRRERAAALDELHDAGATERAERGVGREPARAPRPL